MDHGSSLANIRSVTDKWTGTDEHARRAEVRRAGKLPSCDGACDEDTRDKRGRHQRSRAHGVRTVAVVVGGVRPAPLPWRRQSEFDLSKISSTRGHSSSAPAITTIMVMPITAAQRMLPSFLLMAQAGRSTDGQEAALLAVSPSAVVGSRGLIATAASTSPP